MLTFFRMSRRHRPTNTIGTELGRGRDSSDAWDSTVHTLRTRRRDARPWRRRRGGGGMSGRVINWVLCVAGRRNAITVFLRARDPSRTPCSRLVADIPLC